MSERKKLKMVEAIESGIAAEGARAGGASASSAAPVAAPDPEVRALAKRRQNDRQLDGRSAVDCAAAACFSREARDQLAESSLPSDIRAPADVTPAQQCKSACRKQFRPDRASRSPRDDELRQLMDLHAGIRLIFHPPLPDGTCLAGAVMRGFHLRCKAPQGSREHAPLLHAVAAAQSDWSIWMRWRDVPSRCGAQLPNGALHGDRYSERQRARQLAPGARRKLGAPDLSALRPRRGGRSGDPLGRYARTAPRVPGELRV